MAGSPLRYTMVIQRAPSQPLCPFNAVLQRDARTYPDTVLDAEQSMNFPSKQAVFLLKHFWFRQ